MPAATNISKTDVILKNFCNGTLTPWTNIAYPPANPSNAPIIEDIDPSTPTTQITFQVIIGALLIYMEVPIWMGIFHQSIGLLLFTLIVLLYSHIDLKRR